MVRVRPRSRTCKTRPRRRPSAAPRPGPVADHFWEHRIGCYASVGLRPPSSLKENLRATNCLSSCWGRALDCGLQFIDDLDGHYADSDRDDSRERGEYGAND